MRKNRGFCVQANEKLVNSEAFGAEVVQNAFNNGSACESARFQLPGHPKPINSEASEEQ